MEILPVLDIMHGQVVRAVGGRRSEYRPLVSQLTTSTKPIEIARAIRDRFGWTQLYVADLDAIIGRKTPTWNVFERLQAAGHALWVDAGVRTVVDASEFLRAPVAQVVIGSETIAGPAAWAEIVQILGPERLTFSLDLRDGRALGDATWNSDDPQVIAERVIATGAKRMIVLDLTRIGEGRGVGTEKLCRAIKCDYPDVELIAGGGVRDRSDVYALERVGVDRVLIASALHDGRLDYACHS